MAYQDQSPRTRSLCPEPRAPLARPRAGTRRFLPQPTRRRSVLGLESGRALTLEQWAPGLGMLDCPDRAGSRSILRFASRCWRCSRSHWRLRAGSLYGINFFPAHIPKVSIGSWKNSNRAMLYSSLTQILLCGAELRCILCRNARRLSCPRISERILSPRSRSPESLSQFPSCVPTNLDQNYKARVPYEPC